jgi:hypothetical protein
LLHFRSDQELREAKTATTAARSPVIDDFSRGLRDWYQLNAGNLAHQQTWTRKLTDPLWRGPADAKLILTLKLPKTNRLSFVVQLNEWRSYRGKRSTFVCEREVPGADTAQSLSLGLADFVSAEGPLRSWSEVDQFGICASFAERGGAARPPPVWHGPAPIFTHLEWSRG